MRANASPRVKAADLELMRELKEHATLINLMADGRLTGTNNATTAAPTTGTHAQGDFVRNSTPSGAAPIYGWLCTVAGTPGTWVAVQGGFGFGVGSGGAVTQATSRTTGVTLNKSNGAITLVSAAGSATYASFTVTNSTVAATDVVDICQKSGTDLYEIHVTAVAAGSFQVTFRTTGGTTTEQPVFNFAVIKAVTS